jgi:hypothetical protein
MVLLTPEPDALPYAGVLNPGQYTQDPVTKIITISGALTGVTKPANTSRANNATASADPDLTINLPAGTYSMSGFLSFTAPAAPGGLKAQMFASQALATSRIAWQRAQTGSTTTATVLPNTAPTTVITSATQMDDSSGNSGGLELNGFLIIPSLTTLAITWAQQVSNAVATVIEAGSWMQFNKLA